MVLLLTSGQCWHRQASCRGIIALCRLAVQSDVRMPGSDHGRTVELAGGWPALGGAVMRSSNSAGCVCALHQAVWAQKGDSSVCTLSFKPIRLRFQARQSLMVCWMVVVAVSRVCTYMARGVSSRHARLTTSRLTHSQTPAALPSAAASHCSTAIGHCYWPQERTKQGKARLPRMR